MTNKPKQRLVTAEYSKGGNANRADINNNEQYKL